MVSFNLALVYTLFSRWIILFHCFLTLSYLILRSYESLEFLRYRTYYIKVYSMYVQRWSSWLWRGLNTAEVPGSIPSLCTLLLNPATNVYNTDYWWLNIKSLDKKAVTVVCIRPFWGLFWQKSRQAIFGFRLWKFWTPSKPFFV